MINFLNAATAPAFPAVPAATDIAVERVMNEVGKEELTRALIVSDLAAALAAEMSDRKTERDGSSNMIPLKR